MTRRELWEIIGGGEGVGKDINSVVKCFFVYYSWLAVFCAENIIRKKCSSIEQALNETSERLLLPICKSTRIYKGYRSVICVVMSRRLCHTPLVSFEDIACWYDVLSSTHYLLVTFRGGSPKYKLPPRLPWIRHCSLPAHQIWVTLRFCHFPF